MKIFEYLSLGKRLKTQTDITKDQYKLLKDLKIMLLRITEKIVKIEKKIRVVKLILLKWFDSILKDVKNNGKTIKSIRVKSRGNDVNLCLLIIKVLNTEKKMLKKDYGFDEAFNFFDKIDNKRNKPNEC